jgi:hypothetical protein
MERGRYQAMTETRNQCAPPEFKAPLRPGVAFCPTAWTDLVDLSSAVDTGKPPPAHSGE